MIFTPLKLQGAYLIEDEPVEDNRGFFSRVWCAREFEQHGLNTRLAQCNISFNKSKNTLRGIHYQLTPYAETKLVRCIAGRLYDVLLDLRSESPTFKQWLGIELSASNRKALYIPEGFGHGFQTLEDNTEVFYQISEFYCPAYSRGIRWNDPIFNIVWPEVQSERVISVKDQQYPDFEE